MIERSGRTGDPRTGARVRPCVWASGRTGARTSALQRQRFVLGPIFHNLSVDRSRPILISLPINSSIPRFGPAIGLNT